MTPWIDDEDIFDKAAARASFQLTYGRSPIERKFTPEGISAGDIDDAYNEGETSAGEWSNGYALSGVTLTEDVCLHQFFTDAVTEAVHEALEWFTIDGRRPVDPHAFRVEHEIYNLTQQFAAKLWELRSELDR